MADRDASMDRGSRGGRPARAKRPEPHRGRPAAPAAGRRPIPGAGTGRPRV